MLCEKCGNQLNDNALFCPKCGQKVEKKVQSKGAAVQPEGRVVNSAGKVNGEKAHKKKHKAPVIIVVAFVVIIGFFILPGRGGSTPVNSNGVNDIAMSQETGNDRLSSQGAADSVSSQDSVNELLEIIDQAQELLSKTESDIQTLKEEEDAVERFRKQTDVLANFLSELSDLQKQADAVSGLDTKLENAKNEYFNMMRDSREAYFEVWNFFADYLDLYFNTLADEPKWENYDSYEKYFNDFYTWYQLAIEGYSAIDSCPSCLENEWEQYGNILDLTESSCIKLYQAFQYDDWLRLYSSRYMVNRYEVMEEAQYYKLIDCAKSEAGHFQRQCNIASKLAEEMHTYAELGEEERGGYEFEYIRTNRINVSYESVDTIYPSLYNTYDAFLIIKTGCASGTRKIVVEAEIPGFTQTYKESFTLDAAYRAIYIKPPALTGDLDLSSAKDAQISVTISEQDGTLIEAKTFPVTIKSKYDVEWRTDEYGVATQDNILCFLTPESSAISELKRQAIDEISSMTNGQMESFVGYQNNAFNSHYVGTYLQAAGIMRALYEMGVRYNMDTFSLSGSQQHVLFPEDVLNQRSGLCVETSLTAASALQSAGMHVFLVFPPGHAQVAVEIWNGSGNDTSGTGEYFLIETTALSSDWNNQKTFVNDANALLGGEVLNSSPIQYMNATQWNEYLSTKGAYVIDCNDSRILGLTPFAN